MSLTPTERQRATVMMEMASEWGARLIVSDHAGMPGNQRRVHLVWDYTADGEPKESRPTAPACRKPSQRRSGRGANRDQYHEASIVEMVGLDLCSTCTNKAERREQRRLI